MHKLRKKNQLGAFYHYDCDVMTVKPDYSFIERIINRNPFYFSHTLWWKNFITGMFPDIPTNNNIMSELHSHVVGTESGWIHNDYDAVQFAYKPIQNGLNPWYKNCQYRDIEAKPGLMVNVRSIVLIYHINDKPGWKEGDGGETAFYNSIEADVDTGHTIKVNPLPNRLIAYEINPWSWHSFLKNVKHERDSFIMWYHTDIDIQSRRYPTESDNLWKSNSIIQGKQNERMNFTTNRKDKDAKIIEEKMKNSNMPEYGDVNTLE